MTEEERRTLLAVRDLSLTGEFDEPCAPTWRVGWELTDGLERAGELVAPILGRCRRMGWLRVVWSGRSVMGNTLTYWALTDAGVAALAASDSVGTDHAT